MADSHRDAFERLIVDPSKLTSAQRVDVARQLSGTFLASDDVATRWFGAALGAWLRQGGDLAAVLTLIASVRVK